MIITIPISFEHEGKTYTGELSAGTGSGTTVGSSWHLYIDKRYYGQLFILDRGWEFHSNTRSFENLAEFFGNYIIAWYDSNADF